MSSLAIAGVGVKFLRWDESGGSWDTIAEINSIDGPSMSRDSIDVTSLDSTGGYREFIAGFRDAGAISLTMNFVKGSYDLMKEDYEDPLSKFYQMVFPDFDEDGEELNTSFEFEGLVTELGMAIPTDDKITSSVTIKISGKVEVSEGEESGSPNVGK